MASVPPVTWPSGGALFHAGFDETWRRPFDPRALQAAVGRAPGSSSASTAASRALDTADASFDRAAAPDAQGGTLRDIQQKWTAVATAYAGFLKANPGHEWSSYALHREVRALWNAGRADEALAELLELFQRLRAHPKAGGAAELGAIAIADFPALYVESTRKPSEAAALLTGIARDADDALRVREAIGEAYLAVGRYDDSREVFADLEASHPGAKACVYAARQLTVSIVENPADRQHLLARVKGLLKLRSLVEQGGAHEAGQEQCLSATLAPILELATAWHIEVLGWNGVPGTHDWGTAELAIWLYQSLVEHFTARELAETPLPRVPAASRPSAPRVGVAIGELYRWGHRFEQCAAAYDRTYDPSLSAALRATVVGGAVACRMRLLDELRWPERGQPASRHAADQLAETLKELPELATRYLCLVQPSATDPVGASERLDVALARGRIPFLERRWEIAAAALEPIAFQTGQPQSREAAAMYAISLHQLRVGGNTVCGAELDRVKARLEQLHCSVPANDSPRGYLALPNVTTREKSTALTPCEALRSVGSPPDPALPPPPRPAPPVEPRVWVDSTVVSGAVARESVGWVLGLHTAQLRACYASALRRDTYFVPTAGTVRLSLLIGRDGSVSEAQASFRGFANTPLSSCMQKVLHGIAFFQPEGGLVEVRAQARVSLERGLQLEQMPSVAHPRGASTGYTLSWLLRSSVAHLTPLDGSRGGVRRARAER